MMLRHHGAADTALKYLAALLGQSLASAFHFGLHVVLVRTLDPAAYGMFALSFLAATVGVTFTGTLVILPLTVYTPGLSRRAPRAALEALLSSVNLLLVAGIFLLSFGFAASLIGSSASALAFATFAASFAFRAYSRAFAFARRRPAVALAGDGTLVAIASAAITLTVTLAPVDHLAVVLWSLAVGNLCASGVQFAALGTGMRFSRSRRSGRSRIFTASPPGARSTTSGRV